jgi:hypothetical protein
MTDFSFKAPECEYCGKHLSSSNTMCKHDGKDVSKHVFRKIGQGRESMTGVKSTKDNKWKKLSEKVDNWIAYEYLGPKSVVETNLSGCFWNSVEELPSVEVSARAPSDIESKD